MNAITLRRALLLTFLVFGHFVAGSFVHAESSKFDRIDIAEFTHAVECLESSKQMKGESLFPFLYYRPEEPKITKQMASRFSSDKRDVITTAGLKPLKEFTAQINDDRDTLDHWFLFCLKNREIRPQYLVFEVGPHTLNEVDFYPRKAGLPQFETGSRKLLSSRDLPNSGFGFRIHLNPGETQHFLFRVRGDGDLISKTLNEQKTFLRQPVLSTKIWDHNSYTLMRDYKYSLASIFVGLFLTLMVFNLLVYILAREVTSLLYILWSSCVFVVWLTLDGSFVRYITPNHPEFSDLATALFYPLAIIISGFFFRRFLDLTNYPRLNKTGSAILVLSAPLFLVAFTFGEQIFTQVLDSGALLLTLYFGVFAPGYTWVKDRQAIPKYVLISLMPFCLSLLDQVLFSFGVTDQYYVPFPIVTGVIIAIVLISFYTGLIAYREKQAAQLEALKQLNISNELKSNYNQQLEEELKQKTADMRSMNLDLEEKARRLLQIDESKSRFFANISHEFRTPLTLIEGPLTMLINQPKFREKSTIRNVLKHSNSLKELINQILLLSEIDEKLLDLNTRKLNLVEAVKNITSQFSSLALQKEITLSVSSQQSSIEAYVDLEKLEVIINNLLSNALKFTPAKGSVTIKLNSSATSTAEIIDYSRDEYVSITVSDTGSGIPEEELPFIFDRYYQSASSEQSKSGIGTGIGLALVKELIELHSGEVFVRSNHMQNNITNFGTEFQIFLPLGNAHLSEQEILSEHQSEHEWKLQTWPRNTEGIDDKRSQNLIGNNRHTVLVVDDNQDMRDFIQRLLSDNFTVLTAHDGLHAESVLSEQQPDIIITDLMMPNRDGLELVQTIKRQPNLANIPIIMVSARAGLHDRLNGLMAAVDDYLVKPFNGSELKIRIRNLLQKQAQFRAFYQSQLDLDKDNGAGGAEDIPHDQRNKHAPFLEKAKGVVYRRLEESEFGVEELAKELHVSEATLRRRLAEEAPFTPASLIRHCRLEMARQLIDEGNIRTVAELSRRVGFNKASYFSSLYRKTFNTNIELNSPSN